jgi:hypothetical protein
MDFSFKNCVRVCRVGSSGLEQKFLADSSEMTMKILVPKKVHLLAM